MLRIVALVLIVSFAADQVLMDGRYTRTVKTVTFLLVHRII